ncbi:MAG: S49 family peptidase, partial [Thalassobaculaceae bacterium]
MLWVMAVIGALTTALIVGLVVLVWRFETVDETADLPDRMILQLRLVDTVDEVIAGPSWSRHLRRDRPASLFQMVRSLDRAAGDPRVTAVFADLSHASLSLAEAQELRAAISRFRAAGKPAHAYAESFDEDSGVGVYYLASAFNHITLQPTGLFEVTGIVIEMPMLGDALRELGVTPRFGARHEYKGAAVSFTDRRLPVTVRDNLQKLADRLFAQVTAGIAEARRQSAATVGRLIDGAPLLAKEAKANGLVDWLAYRDQAVARMRGEAGARAFVSVAEYYPAAVAAAADSDRPRIAVVPLTGDIARRGASRLREGSDLTAGQVRRVFRALRREARVRAVVLRVDSPGGSYIAADAIRHEIGRLVAAGKTVVVSMSDLAASGGYFIALAADHVLAQAGSITGSIGVFGGKFVTHDLLARWSAEVASVRAGGNAGIYSPFRDFSAPQQARMDAILDAIYADFTNRTMRARALGQRAIDSAARGRVWTGADAKQLG